VQVEGFICADAPDLPTEDPQIRYRLGTHKVQETSKIGKGGAAEVWLVNGQW